MLDIIRAFQKGLGRSGSCTWAAVANVPGCADRELMVRFHDTEGACFALKVRVTAHERIDGKALNMGELFSRLLDTGGGHAIGGVPERYMTGFVPMTDSPDRLKAKTLAASLSRLPNLAITLAALSEKLGKASEELAQTVPLVESKIKEVQDATVIVKAALGQDSNHPPGAAAETK